MPPEALPAGAGIGHDSSTKTMPSAEGAAADACSPGEAARTALELLQLLRMQERQPLVKGEAYFLVARRWLQQATSHLERVAADGSRQHEFSEPVGASLLLLCGAAVAAAAKTSGGKINILAGMRLPTRVRDPFLPISPARQTIVRC